MPFSTIETEKKEHIGYIYINRPEVRNALNVLAWTELMEAFREYGYDDDVFVIILSGRGSKAFAAGADLNALKERSAAATLDNLNTQVTAFIENIPKPTIAAINGYALGGGLEIAMACDIRIASDNAKLGQTEMNVGILPGAGGTQRLSRTVGPGIAKEMIFTGSIISAERAKEIGLVNQIYPSDELISEAGKLASKIASKSPLITKIAKLAIDSGAQCDITTAVTLEKIAQSFVFSTEDHLEGITAFLEKRDPVFKGK